MNQGDWVYIKTPTNEQRRDSDWTSPMDALIGKWVRVRHVFPQHIQVAEEGGAQWSLARSVAVRLEGELVVRVRAPQDAQERGRWSWYSHMDQYVGQDGVVENSSISGDHIYVRWHDGQCYYYPVKALTPVLDAPPPPPVPTMTDPDVQVGQIVLLPRAYESYSLEFPMVFENSHARLVGVPMRVTRVSLDRGNFRHGGRAHYLDFRLVRAAALAPHGWATYFPARALRVLTSYYGMGLDQASPEYLFALEALLPELEALKLSLDEGHPLRRSKMRPLMARLDHLFTARQPRPVEG